MGCVKKTKCKRSGSRIKPFVRLAVGAAAATGVAAGINAYIASRGHRLQSYLPFRHDWYQWDTGRVAYFHAGSGHPVVLIHSHNAAASAYEYRQIIAELAEGYRVFIPDLPGFGMSDRRRRPYFPDTYIRFLLEFLRDVVRQPATVIASSLSAAHAIRAAVEQPELIADLVVVAPTGLIESTVKPEHPLPLVSAALRVPVWGQSVFNIVVARSAIQKYLRRQVFRNPWHVTEDMIEQAWLTAHQPNALEAPQSFISGATWLDVRDDYTKVTQPLMVVWGRDDVINPYVRNAGALSANSQAAIRLIADSGALPQEEQSERFLDIATEFMSENGHAPRRSEDTTE
ncbi:MAG: alpha/beta fold hydrolase [Armatimonadetes bacterium]|nr:alpha/beta fold hydrolase [Armatimonadota bacterium]